ncbi:5-histidylcysteine sulfoxide synthase [Marinobacterium sp. AK62]|uniref:5-histidylcysteine sulfoxide synthase n=1 Tax=Marinobacterium alkalitolerans TaxID=1542925 RepID=A0ABS3Z6E7_9GAMM|nr:5-histidylcysteine sulfoxide synthase [Marinobacterium alkalitolerans]MBP0047176.1 5-histidylcysteine sulfoxide synthase [Marinobacterium alkalitolerans]
MERLTRTPRLDNPDTDALRREILDYFHTTCDRYEQLFEVLTCDEAYTVKPIPLRHPLIFYYGHTATFFINKLLLSGLIETRINPHFESIFAVGVDEMSWDDLNDDHYDWPTVEAVRAYRHQVRQRVDRVIREAPLTTPVTWDHPWWTLLMGIEHERIHLETSSVLIRQHALKYVQSHPAWPACRDSGPAPANQLIEIPAGRVTLGKARDDAFYGWDNEYGEHVAELNAFKAAQMLVSNQEFLAFVEAGGYAEPNWWSEEGWQWCQFAKAEHPTFWVHTEQAWELRLMCEQVLMPWDWPVEVNCHEAEAFCRWKADQTGEPIRLPSEDEWYRLYDLAQVGAPAPGDTVNANLHLDHFASSCPVYRFAQGDFFDISGNVWQWTQTPIYPFEGFAVYPYYDDFTTPTFDDQHNLIKGGSWISCGNESLRSARYAFRRHFFQHAGFRYVSGPAPEAPVTSRYETDELAAQYADFHYGESHFSVANFPRTLARLAIELAGPERNTKALDLGCATGRASFELAHHFRHVDGVDFSARLINLGVQLQQQGRLRYTLPEEGELVSYHECDLASLGLSECAERVNFIQGDACNLKPILTGYDLILAANLIDRLYDPRQFLEQVHTRLNPDGLLVLASPYTWLEAHTPKEAWLGGFKRDGESVTTLDGLHAVLDTHFERIREPEEIPFVIRETRRKYQHTLSEVTCWRLRS